VAHSAGSGVAGRNDALERIEALLDLAERDLDGSQAVVEPAHVGPYLGQVGPQVVDPDLGEGTLAEDERPMVR